MNEKRYEATVDLIRELKRRSDPDVGEPDWQDDSYNVQRYQLVLGDSVGDCSIEIDENMLGDLDAMIFDFKITLGPVNADKLINFLKALPPEPEDESHPLDGTVVCGACAGTGAECVKCNGIGRVRP